MRVMKTVSMLIFLIVPLCGISAQEKGAPAKPAASSAPAAPSDSTVFDELTSFSRKESLYDSGGKRDPFGSLVPKEAEEGKKIKGLLNYEKAVLSGIARTGDDTYALVIDADGFGHVLREGYMVYGGYVTSITENAVYLHIVKYGRAMTIILSLESSKSTVIAEEDGEKVVRKPGINIYYEPSSQSQMELDIQDIVVPSLRTRTLDEEWFGGKGRLPIIEKPEGNSGSNAARTFSLFDPPDDSWIKLPYELDWTNFADADDKGITYIVTIDDDREFNPPHVAMEQVRTSSYLLVGDMNLPVNRQLFWKVVVIDESGIEHSCRQSHLSFKIVSDK